MAIFSRKKVCPICGRAIKGDVLIRIKDNVELCKVCSSQINMDSSMIPNQTVDDIKEHLAYRAENQRKMEQFNSDWSASAGPYILRADEKLMLWYCTNNRSDKNPPLFNFDDLKSAVYLENGEPAEELQTGLKSLFGERKAPTLINSMKIIIELDNPYTHEIVAETLGTGKGMTTGTVQYKMQRKSIHEMMECLESIQNFSSCIPGTPFSETEDGNSFGDDSFGMNDTQQDADTWEAQEPDAETQQDADTSSDRNGDF